MHPLSFCRWMKGAIQKKTFYRIMEPYIPHSKNFALKNNYKPLNRTEANLQLFLFHACSGRQAPVRFLFWLQERLGCGVCTFIFRGKAVRFQDIPQYCLFALVLHHGSRVCLHLFAVPHFFLFYFAGPWARRKILLFSREP